MNKANYENKVLRGQMDNPAEKVIAFSRAGKVGYPEIRLSWTKGGVYGCQVRTFIFQAGDGDCMTERTNGCGYSKMGEAITRALEWLGIKSVKNYSFHSDDIYRYRIGGNFHVIPLEDCELAEDNQFGR